MGESKRLKNICIKESERVKGEENEAYRRKGKKRITEGKNSKK